MAPGLPDEVFSLSSVPLLSARERTYQYSHDAACIARLSILSVQPNRFVNRLKCDIMMWRNVASIATLWLIYSAAYWMSEACRFLSVDLSVSSGDALVNVISSWMVGRRVYSCFC
jgi:hypothetical protein